MLRSARTLGAGSQQSAMPPSTWTHASLMHRKRSGHCVNTPLLLLYGSESLAMTEVLMKRLWGSRLSVCAPCANENAPRLGTSHSHKCHESAVFEPARVGRPRINNAPECGYSTNTHCVMIQGSTTGVQLGWPLLPGGLQ